MTIAVPQDRARAARVATSATPLRVVINGRFLAQVATGVQRYARETLLALDRLLADEPGLRTRLAFELAVPGGADVPALAHMAVQRLPLLRGHLWEQLALPWHARGAYLVNFSYSGPLVKRRQLITVHDASVAACPQAYAAGYRRVHDFLVRALRDRVDTVMTVSRFSRDELARRYGIRRALVGLEGWQHALAADDGSALLTRWQLEPQRYLLAVGSAKPHKNFALIEQALALLDDLPLTVAIAGADDIDIFRRGRPLGPRVHALGFVSDAELSALYRHAAWFVFPSLYEGFGLPALEAMANGCPVLAARAASIPEVCGDAALYFDPHDPQSLAALLRRVAAEPALRDAVRARAAGPLAHYSWAGNARILVRRLLALAPRTAEA